MRTRYVVQREQSVRSVVWRGLLPVLGLLLLGWYVLVPSAREGIELMLPAALLGALLARWWLRRGEVDVTSEYTSLREDWASWRTSVDAKLAHPPTVDLAPVIRTVAAIRVPEMPQVDLEPIGSRLAAIERRLSEPRPAELGKIDLSPLQQWLEALERSVRGMALPAPESPDLGAVVKRLDQLEQRMAGIRRC